MISTIKNHKQKQNKHLKASVTKQPPKTSRNHKHLRAFIKKTSPKTSNNQKPPKGNRTKNSPQDKQQPTKTPQGIRQQPPRQTTTEKTEGGSCTKGKSRKQMTFIFVLLCFFYFLCFLDLLLLAGWLAGWGPLARLPFNHNKRCGPETP